MFLKNHHIKCKNNTVRHKALTLKKRIIVSILLSAIIPFFSITSISYYTITSILQNKLMSSIKSNLTEDVATMQDTLDILNNVSQQLSIYGTLGQQIEEYISSEQPYVQSELMEKMQEEIAMITFSNPKVVVLAYYLKNSNTFFMANTATKDDISFDKLQTFATYQNFIFYGPHPSISYYSNRYVLSELRKLDTESDIYIYVESSFDLTKHVLDSDKIGGKMQHLFLDTKMNVTFSELPKIFPTGRKYSFSKGDSGVANEYYWFKSTSNQGWSLVSLISKSDYNKEIYQWVSRVILLFILFLLLSTVVAIALWRMFYRPMKKFEKEIKWAESSNFDINTDRTNIPEFDDLLDQFREMKSKILELFNQVEQKEKKRADLEIEILINQINPHFLLNTLDVIHWMAVMNKQSDIDRITQSLKKLLGYNLSKSGRQTTLQDELNATREYLTLQQVRYSFQYQISVDDPKRSEEFFVPKFILQPLVENSIYHGMTENGLIEITVVFKKYLEITVRDNGCGISETQMDLLMNNKPTTIESHGMGIGLNYVKRMLDSYYGGRAEFIIQSTVGSGTTITMKLPLSEEEGY